MAAQVVVADLVRTPVTQRAGDDVTRRAGRQRQTCWSSRVEDCRYLGLQSYRTRFGSVGLGWVPGGSSHTEPEEVRLEV